ncbi:sensor histidine kinase [Rhodocyclus tenuis]|uniref:sensor histidine kinase n=1 Tax=Rhodocyclus tenuis TaxID=1066 RepID=UPI001F5B896F|nr:PAS domain-containing sensor histidine kinase [Rhodocyclus tenuis]
MGNIAAMTKSPASPRQEPATQAWSSWYLTIPKLAVTLLLVLLIALLWLLRQNEVEEQRSTLIADVLWLEQNVRFHLDGNTETLQQLALDIAFERDANRLFATRARHILRNSPELTQIFWLDAQGRMIDALPPAGTTPAAPAKAAKNNTSTLASERADKLLKPVYSDILGESGEASFELHLPVREPDSAGNAGRARGEIVAVYSLDALLKHLTPWWLAEKYQVRIVDGNGKVLASKSRVDAGDPLLSYKLAFDPPGYGLLFHVTAYKVASSVAQTLIATLILILAGAVLLSLWVVHGLIQRRLAAEQALRAEHAFRKAMEDSLTVGMRARDRDGRITYVNPAFCQMVGFSPEELIGCAPPMPYWAPEEKEKSEGFYHATLAGRGPGEGFELRFRHKNGERVDVLVCTAPLINADGEHTGWMSSILDITARKRADELARQQEEKLQVTSRLVTMGEMASMLAHELNQPLAAIASYNTGCLNKLESGTYTVGELRDALGKLGVQAQRAGQIIRRVHDFVRKSEPKLAPCDLAEMVDDSIGFIEAVAKSRNVRILREVQGMRPEIQADRVMLEQVLVNLMRNAVEAMADLPPERRNLTIALARVDRQMQIRVIDTGPGIPEDTRDKLFTPFFSSKPEGMGMGLNICRSIIEFHHGRLWLEANPQGGCVFVINLPISTETAADGPAS